MNCTAATTRNNLPSPSMRQMHLLQWSVYSYSVARLPTNTWNSNCQLGPSQPPFEVRNTHSTVRHHGFIVIIENGTNCKTHYTSTPSRFSTFRLHERYRPIDSGPVQKHRLSFSRKDIAQLIVLLETSTQSRTEAWDPERD